MRQPELRSAIIRSGVTESMPFHDLTASAVLYGDFSAIAAAVPRQNVFISLVLAPATDSRCSEPGRIRPVRGAVPIAVALPGAADKCGPSAPPH
ncbi:hypothetical protein D3C78_1569730 [compost metagenome]